MLDVHTHILDPHCTRRVRCAFAFASKQKAQRKRRKPQMIRRRRRIRLISPRHATANLSIFCSVTRVHSLARFLPPRTRERTSFVNHDTFISIQISINLIRFIFKHIIVGMSLQFFNFTFFSIYHFSVFCFIIKGVAIFQ